MSVRDSMRNLIRKLRQMGQAGMEDYKVVDEIYWSDQHIQDILDSHRSRMTEAALITEPDYVSGSDIYTRYRLGLSPQRFGVEGTAEGTPYFRIADSTGATIAASGYTFNDADLSVTFTANTEGSARYLSGYSYDLNGAARDLWLLKASHSYTAINFTADGHRFERGKIYDTCMNMVKFYEGAGGLTSGKQRRMDLNGPGEGEHF